MEQQPEKHGIRSGATVVEQAGDTRMLFRKTAVKAAQQRWFGPVLIVTPPSLTVAIWLAALATACLITAAVTIEIPERIRAQGVLLPSDGLLRVRASRSGWVDKLDIANGVAVSRGQALMWLTDAERAPLHQPETLERIASLRNELRLLDESMRQEIDAAADRELFGRRRLQLTRDRIAFAQQEYQLRLRQTELQQRRSKRLFALVADAAISAHSADEQSAATLEAQAAKDAAGQRVMALKDELAILDLQSLQDAATPLRLRTQAGIRRESLLREIAESQLKSVLEVTSPGDGSVAGLAVRAGSFVQAGQVLLTLHDPRDALEAYLYISADNAGMIKLGQSVELQLRAYPHQLFGTQSATITSVSAVAIPGHEVDSGIVVAGPVFEIRAALTSASIQARGDVWPLPPGTVFAADLIRRRWPLYRWLLRSITDGESPHA
jgi:membrane fusion protein